ncbi:DNA ligase-1 [Microlunatus soli]|uniref:DNA ligase n=1 Tax=Microlunatus soli TaxID=630515 RepID=A0A1H1WRD9_9ACTN|nr:DNA ligase-1 [Microlunatus soli]
MALDRLVTAWRDLGATRSRNAKRDIIAGVLTETGTDDVRTVVSYLSGSLRQRRTGIGWRTVQQLPEPADTPTLTVAAVDAELAGIAELSGPGSAGRRQQRVAALFARATAQEQQLLRGLIFGELRQGALESAVQDGLAAAYGVPRQLVARAAMLLGSTADAAEQLSTGGESALRAVQLAVGVAVQPMLAASAPDTAAAIGKTGPSVVVDAKLDGVRVQVHKDGPTVKIYSRSLDEITDRMPQIVAAVAALPHDQLVLDGEALALRPDGTPEAFQEIASSAATRAEQGQQRLPLRAYFFDLLRIGDHDLLDEPLQQRDATMTEMLPAELLVPRLRTEQPEEVESFYRDVVEQGFEGVVIKNPTSGYAAGRRDAGWIKVKPRHTFDLVVTAAEWGHGRRRGWLSNLHLAARDERTGGLVMLGKTFKGLTDEMLTWQTQRFLELETGRTTGVVSLRPEVVVEIACDGLQTSPRYPGGVALRFARVLRYREDKTPDQADTIDTVKRLLVSSPRNPSHNSNA